MEPSCQPPETNAGRRLAAGIFGAQDCRPTKMCTVALRPEATLPESPCPLTQLADARPLRFNRLYIKPPLAGADLESRRLLCSGMIGKVLVLESGVVRLHFAGDSGVHSAASAGGCRLRVGLARALATVTRGATASGHWQR